VIALGVAIASAAAFILSAVYYGVMPAPDTVEPAPQRPLVALILVEMLRNLTLAALVAGLVAAADWSGPGKGLLLGLALWAVPVVLLAGSVFHEGVPLRRAGLHAGDWLIKLGAIGAITGLFS
jgi:hypothetical protein